jgi:hypothetical protein
MIRRIARNTAIACVALAVIALVVRRNFSAPLGVFGGGVLIALSFWAIRGAVDGLVGGQSSGESPRKPARLQLVKFFTRHAMLALAAYGMMVRLHLDPVGVLAGVSSLAVALAVEVIRDLRWRRFP